MKRFKVVILSLLVLTYGMPTSAHAVATRQVIALPEARAGEPYRIDIEAVLRDEYRLRIDAGAPASILQWYAVDGEVPPGLAIRQNGVVEGTPTVQREQPYGFRLKVVDIAARGTEPLTIEFSIRVSAAQIRLTKINSVALVPIEPAPSGRGNGYAAPRDDAGDEAEADAATIGVSAPPVTDAGTGAAPQIAEDATATTAAEQEELPECGSAGAFPNLFRRAGSGKCKVTIDTPAEAIPKPVEVTNGTVVTVRGTKSPVNSCAVETKREELKPEPSPFGQILKIIAGFGVFGIQGLAADVELCATDPSGAAVPDDPEARQVEAAIKSIRRDLSKTRREIDQGNASYKLVAERIEKFTSCDGHICDNEANFNSEKNALKLALPPLPTFASTELQLTSLKKVLAARYRRPNPTAKEEGWIKTVNERLDCFAQNLVVAQKLRESLAALQGDFEKFFNLLQAHKTAFEYKKALIADANAKVTGTVTCTNFFTKQVAVQAIPFTINYQDLPRATVTAGLLFTTLDKRQIGTQPVRTGTAADGTPTFRLAFAETDRASSQVVPFSFFNYYLSGTRALNLNLSGGVGLNPNNGSNQVEYFFGGAFGHNNIFLQFGGHVGRWQELGGGFNLDETVPDKFPSSVPITRRYSVRPAFGVSYKLPLP